MPVPAAGVIAALWSPTDPQGRILEAEVKSHLEFLRRAGVHGIMVLGSTGEFVRLSLEARRHLLELARTDAGLPIIANISDVRPEVVAELGGFARELGCDSVSILPPWYFPLPQDDMAEFFVRAAEAAGLPVFLYNFPERTGNRIGPETIAWVCERVPVAGVKQSGAEFAYHQELIELGRRLGFVVFTGGEGRLIEAMGLGAVGAVSGVANAAPELVVQAYEAVKRGAIAEAEVMVARLRELIALLNQVEFPACIAAAMEARGLAVGAPKLPRCAASQARYASLAEALQGCYHSWGLIA